METGIERLKERLIQMSNDGYTKIKESRTALKLIEMAEKRGIKPDVEKFLDDLHRKALIRWAEKTVEEERKFGREGKSRRWGKAILILINADRIGKKQLIESTPDKTLLFESVVRGGIDLLKEGNKEVLDTLCDVIEEIVREYDISPNVIDMIDSVVKYAGSSGSELIKRIGDILISKAGTINTWDDLVKLAQNSDIFFIEFGRRKSSYVADYITRKLKEDRLGRMVEVVEEKGGKLLLVNGDLLNDERFILALRNGGYIYRILPWKIIIPDRYGGVDSVISLRNLDPEDERKAASMLPITEKLLRRIEKAINNGNMDVYRSLITQIHKISPKLAEEIEKRYGMKYSNDVQKFLEYMRAARDAGASDYAMKMILKEIDPSIARLIPGSIIGPSVKEKIAERLRLINEDLTSVFEEWYDRRMEVISGKAKRMLTKIEGKPDIVIVWDDGLKCSQGDDFFVPSLNEVTAQLIPGDVTPARIVSVERRRGAYGDYKLIRVEPLSIDGNVIDGFNPDQYGDIRVVVPRFVKKNRRNKYV